MKLNKNIHITVKMDGPETKVKSFFQPKRIAELLPEISSILSQDSRRALTAEKASQRTTALTRTSEKAVKPLTTAEMRVLLEALQGESPKRCNSQNTVNKNWNTSVKVDRIVSRTANGQLKHNSVRKALNFQPKPKTSATTINPETPKFLKPEFKAEKSFNLHALQGESPKSGHSKNSVKENWNSSVKVDRTISYTANGQLKHNLVRKTLNFQPKPKTSVRATTINPETPKFLKPELKAKKSLNLHAKNISAKNNIRISGVYNIPETPVMKSNSSYKSRMTHANKEIISNQSSDISKCHSTPSHKVPLQKKLSTIPDSPSSNSSWKSSGDASFLQAENEIEEKTLVEDYRNVKDFFNTTNDIENSDTVKCSDKLKISKENSKKDDSVILALSDMLHKATVNYCEKGSTEDENLRYVQKQMELINNGIETLMKIKLTYAGKLINEKHSVAFKGEYENIVKPNETEEKKERMGKETKIEPNSNTVCSVIKSCSKSPSYKIPKKNLCLRKKVFHKSMPNVSNYLQTPAKDTSNKVLSMYMKMKEQMNFLNTPLKCQITEIPNTPTVTSQNLQMQLDKLYNCS